MTGGEGTADDGDGNGGEESGTKSRIEVEAERAVEGFDQGIVDLLAWLLDTETRARIYIFLRTAPGSTSDEIAAGTGLYPSTVRESLAALHEEEIVMREKRESTGAGNNPYEYTAIAPSALVGDVVMQIQNQLNTVCNLDRHLRGEPEAEETPIHIEIRDEEDGDGDGI